MANLFGHHGAKRLASEMLVPDFESKLEIVQAWHHDFHFGTLRQDKETSREQAFNKQFFGDLLGYVEKPNTPYTFEPKSSTSTGQLPDARIGYFDTKGEFDKTFAVIELKGAGISLDKPQKGHGNLSPVQQGFKYKPQYRNCDFVIVSNFYETRLYNDTLMDFESWTLDDLVNPADNFINLRMFIFLLSADNFIAANGKSQTQSLLLETRSQQEAMGKKFYADYKEARASLISDLWLRNESVQANPNFGIEKAQKVLDRVVFACFAEDSGFIPDATLAKVLKESSDSAFGTIWGTLKTFFDAIDEGSTKLGIPVGFNGGLFARDVELDSLTFSDEPLKKVLRLGDYDFSDDLSVTILGHIFEQSISDLEEIRSIAQNARDLSAGRLSKRKKDGIFYTPDHVVRTIVDKSLGEYLRRLEIKCLEDAGVNDKLSDENFEKRQLAGYGDYLEKLQKVRVIDPSCGSGAFIVASFDYLLAENKRVNEILGPNLLGHESVLKSVLQNNIFGVDLNEESVEITKLSLWLKSASLGQKLTTLDSNIKCGNSLVSDKEVTPEKAFDWQMEFSEIMKSGGFDVVVGNPPYVDSELMVKSNPKERNFISKNFVSAQGNWDLFVPFYQRAFDLLKPNGICSMIVPNKILIANYAARLREYVLENGALLGIVDVSAKGVFDVDVYPVIVTTSKQRNQSSVEIQSDLDDLPVLKTLDANNSNWGILLSSNDAPVGLAQTCGLEDLFSISPAATVAEAYELKEALVEDAHAVSLRVVNTGTIDPYIHDWGLFPMTYIKGRYLNPVAPASIATGKKIWQSKDKVIVAGMSQTIEAVFSEGDELFPAKSTVVVTEKDGSGLSAYVALILLNSEPFRKRFINANKLNAMAGGYITISRGNLSDSTIPAALNSKSAELDALGRKVVAITKDLRELGFQLKKFIQSEFGDEAWSAKMKQWWTLDFVKFTKALSVSLSMTQKNELVEIYDDYVARGQALSRSLDEAIKESDELVEGLYA